jgi:hypothetical protein
MSATKILAFFQKCRQLVTDLSQNEFSEFQGHFLITQAVLYAKNYSEKRTALVLVVSGI